MPIRRFRWLMLLLHLLLMKQRRNILHSIIRVLKIPRILLLSICVRHYPFLTEIWRSLGFVWRTPRLLGIIRSGTNTSKSTHSRSLRQRSHTSRSSIWGPVRTGPTIIFKDAFYYFLSRPGWVLGIGSVCRRQLRFNWVRTPQLLLLEIIDLVLKICRLFDGWLILVSLSVHWISFKYRLLLLLIMTLFTNCKGVILLHFYL